MKHHDSNSNHVGPTGTPHFSAISRGTPVNKRHVSYDYWSYEIKSIYDHHLENVLHGGIMRLLKGATADIMKYLGPLAMITDVLLKLDFVYGTVSSFDVLINPFIKFNMLGVPVL